MLKLTRRRSVSDRHIEELMAKYDVLQAMLLKLITEITAHLAALSHKLEQEASDAE